jgi:energy-converting hydrogenase Eha subunit A
MGLDSLAPQAEGSGQKSLIGLYCQRGILISLLACVPIGLLWIFSSLVLQALFRIEKDVAELTSSFIHARLLGLPIIAVFEVMRRFAQSQRLAWPTLVACVAGAVFNLIGTYLFLRFASTPEAGLAGTGYSIALSQLVMLLTLLGVLVALRRSETLKGSWEWPSVKELFSGWGQCKGRFLFEEELCLTFFGLLKVLAVSVPAAISLFVEWGNDVFPNHVESEVVLKRRMGSFCELCCSIGNGVIFFFFFFFSFSFFFCLGRVGKSQHHDHDECNFLHCSARNRASHGNFGWKLSR